MDSSALFDATHGHVFPTEAQRAVLEASIHAGARSIEAYKRWRTLVDIEQPFEWEMSRLLPLVYRQLTDAGYDDAVMPRLKGVYRRFWAETTHVVHRATPVIQALVDGGVDVLVLKGVAIGVAYYGNTALRPMSDVDIGVRSVDLERALELLAQHGWHSTKPFTSERRKWFHALQLKNASGDEFDLHWRPMVEATDAALEASLWSSTEPMPLCNRTVRILAPTEQLFHVLLHGMRWNLTTPIRWITDAAQVLKIRGSDIDWTRFVDLCRSFRVSRRVGLAIRFLRERLAIDVPLSVQEELDAIPVRWRERLEAHIVLADQRHWQEHFRYNYWRMCGDYVRVAEAGLGPVRLLLTYPSYVCFYADIGSRRQLFGMAVRGLLRRVGLLKRVHVHHPVSS